MDLGWVVTVVSPTNPTAQVTIVSTDDPAAPGISVEGRSTLHASRAERHDGERSVPPLRLSSYEGPEGHRFPATVFRRT